MQAQARSTRANDRPNLVLEVVRTPSAADKLRILRAKLSGPFKDAAGMIYTATVKNALVVSAFCRDQLRLDVEVYHAKVQPDERERIRTRFENDDVKLVVATNAFGSDVDKPNIRFVIHYDLPGSLDAYANEAGRAGADGEPATVLVLYRPADARVQTYFLAGKYPDIESVHKVLGILQFLGQKPGGAPSSELSLLSGVPPNSLKLVLALLKRGGYIRNVAKGTYGLCPTPADGTASFLDLPEYDRQRSLDHSKVALMLQYCETGGCRRKFLLNYFGEEYAQATCGACDNCRTQTTRGSENDTAAAASTNGEGAFRVGDTVRHDKFGEGIVERSERDLVTVLFVAHGYKTLLASALSHLPARSAELM